MQKYRANSKVLPVIKSFCKADRCRTVIRLHVLCSLIVIYTVCDCKLSYERHCKGQSTIITKPFIVTSYHYLATSKWSLLIATLRIKSLLGHCDWHSLLFLFFFSFLKTNSILLATFKLSSTHNREESTILLLEVFFYFLKNLLFWRL